MNKIYKEPIKEETETKNEENVKEEINNADKLC